MEDQLRMLPNTRLDKIKCITNKARNYIPQTSKPKRGNIFTHTRQ
jgi:hypothetical protein